MAMVVSAVSKAICQQQTAITNIYEPTGMNWTIAKASKLGALDGHAIMGPESHIKAARYSHVVNEVAVLRHGHYSELTQYIAYISVSRTLEVQTTATTSKAICRRMSHARLRARSRSSRLARVYSLYMHCHLSVSTGCMADCSLSPIVLTENRYRYRISNVLDILPLEGQHQKSTKKCASLPSILHRLLHMMHNFAHLSRLDIKHYGLL